MTYETDKPICHDCRSVAPCAIHRPAPTGGFSHGVISVFGVYVTARRSTRALYKQYQAAALAKDNPTCCAIWNKWNRARLAESEALDAMNVVLDSEE